MSGLVRIAFVATLCSVLAPNWAAAQFFDFPKAKKAGETEKSTATVAVFELRGAISERPSAADPIFGDPHQESLRSLVKRIDSAAKDEDVKAAVLLVEGGSFGP